MKIILLCEKCFSLYKNTNLLECNICGSSNLQECEIECSDEKDDDSDDE